MEAANDQSANPVGGSLLRYPLRSATKSKDAKVAEEPQVTSSTRRVRTTQNVSMSMNVLDLSVKEKSSKPPQRLSNPMKPTNIPHSIPIGNLTPLTDNRKNRLNSDTPMSDASKSSSRRRFCVLSSVSYWLTQVKISEAASKHSISLGFFRLALESGVEPLHRIREDLKSYVLKHNLLEELGDATKDVLNSYSMLEEIEKLQISESCSQMPEDGSQNPHEVAKYSETNVCVRNLKPKFVGVNTLVESNKKEAVQKRMPSAATKKLPSLKNPENVENVNTFVGNTAPRRSQKPGKQEKSKGMDEKNSSNCEVDDSTNEEPKLYEKENMDAGNLDF